ncbi:hypothetical protein VHA01S_003_00500 [Vibrio halioticoli NBRC 102217]|uniref:Glycosyltransferase n=1 Tax=Vibrio halioticoli NBRC 102217 TaxID=1219072 RepID=V5EYV3_9VIBR|nr:glycosyltransferase family 52 [Vibrio halioticoli]GAD87974.1 hypothetical protein VHA01S_003_00500 [Vibrio halioticoli NBRC 102217]
MNLYICSTLRHVIFSISKAINDKEPTKIIYFFDYQKVKPSTFDQSTLPNNIELVLLSRKLLTKHLRENFLGKITYVFAQWGLTLPKSIRHRLSTQLHTFNPKLYLSSQDINLFLFNNRNKMSRIFSCLVSNYRIIEDGMGNYLDLPVKKSKYILRLLQGKSIKYWNFGEEKKCIQILVLYPNRLHPKIRKKGHKITFLDTEEGNNAILSLFSVATSDIPEIIIATQPFSPSITKKLKCKNIEEYFCMNLVNYCVENGISHALKVHPRERKEKYSSYLSSNKILNEKLPLEVFLLGNKYKPIVLSLNSTAGVGFEEYCERVTLVDDDSTLDSIAENLALWEKKPELLNNQLSEKLSPYLTHSLRK